MTAIRLAGDTDAGQVQAIYAPVVRETATSFETEVPTVAEMRERILRTTERGTTWCGSNMACANTRTTPHRP